MRLVIVNHMHPSIPHVSGMRAWYFARELAAKGHRVILLCEVRDGVEPAPGPERIGAVLCEHDWSNPLVIPIKPRPMNSLRWLRSSQTPVLFRKALVLWSYLRHSGVFTDFRRGVQPYLPTLAHDFRPEAVWGIFGNTDCWLIAQRLARLSGCSWIGDMKDSWGVFMPTGLRRLIAHHFRDMAGATANSEFTASALKRWFGITPEIIYSGIADSFMRPQKMVEDDVFRITLTGSIYSRQLLSEYFCGIFKWLKKNNSDRVEFVYAGGSSELVKALIDSLQGHADVKVFSYLPIDELAKLCCTASVNTYIWHSNTFHHKLLELLACNRPVIAFPGESDESKRLATVSGKELLTCSNQYELAAVLDNLYQQRHTCLNIKSNLEQLSWTAQSVILEQVFQIVSQGRN